MLQRIHHRLLRECEKMLLDWRLRDLGGVGIGVACSGPVTLLCRQQIRFGNRVSIAGFLHIWGHGGVTVGDDVMIGSHVAISSITHDPSAKRFKGTNLLSPVIIEDNIWIGSHVFIGSGVTVGEGSILAAGAVVLSDVPRKVVMAGVPARVKKTL
jgi:maltose O-acetyltransferase